MALNDCKFIGRLVRDVNDDGVVTVKQINGQDTKIYKNSLAVERDYTDSSGKRPVDFIDFTAWRQQADFLEKYAQKGKMILISGRLEVRSWKPEGAEYSRKDVSINANYTQVIEWPDKDNNNTNDALYENVPF